MCEDSPHEESAHEDTKTFTQDEHSTKMAEEEQKEVNKEAVRNARAEAELRKKKKKAEEWRRKEDERREREEEQKKKKILEDAERKRLKEVEAGATLERLQIEENTKKPATVPKRKKKPKTHRENIDEEKREIKLKEDQPTAKEEEKKSIPGISINLTQLVWGPSSSTTTITSSRKRKEKKSVLNKLDAVIRKCEESTSH